MRVIDLSCRKQNRKRKAVTPACFVVVVVCFLEKENHVDLIRSNARIFLNFFFEIILKMLLKLALKCLIMGVLDERFIKHLLDNSYLGYA